MSYIAALTELQLLIFSETSTANIANKIHQMSPQTIGLYICSACPYYDTSFHEPLLDTVIHRYTSVLVLRSPISASTYISGGNRDAVLCFRRAFGLEFCLDFGLDFGLDVGYLSGRNSANICNRGKQPGVRLEITDIIRTTEMESKIIDLITSRLACLHSRCIHTHSSQILKS